jgi:hypothetical protein
MSTPEHTRWTVMADDTQAPLSGSAVASAANAIGVAQLISETEPHMHVRVIGWHRLDDGWDSGQDIAQFKAGEPLPEQDWV